MELGLHAGGAAPGVALDAEVAGAVLLGEALDDEGLVATLDLGRDVDAVGDEAAERRRLLVIRSPRNVSN